jgi:hypothetical protein
MHRYTEETDALARAISEYARARIAEPQPLDRTVPVEELDRLAGSTITPEGLNLAPRVGKLASASASSAAPVASGLQQASR